MDYILCILGFILALFCVEHKKLRWILRLFLSCITSYGIFKFRHPGTFIITDENLWREAIDRWISSRDCVEGIVVTGLCMIFFYVVLRMALVQIAVRYLRKYAMSFYKKQTDDFKRGWAALHMKRTRKGLRSSLSRGLRIFTFGKKEDETELHSTDLTNPYITWTLIGIHGIISLAIVFDFNHPILISIVCLFLFLYFAVTIAILPTMFADIKKVGEHEDDLMKRDITTLQ